MQHFHSVYVTLSPDICDIFSQYLAYKLFTSNGLKPKVCQILLKNTVIMPDKERISLKYSNFTSNLSQLNVKCKTQNFKEQKEFEYLNSN